MESIYSTWLLGLVWLGLLWLFFRRNKRFRRLHWIFLLMVLIVIPWTSKQGFLISFASYMVIYFIAMGLEKLTNRWWPSQLDSAETSQSPGTADQKKNPKKRSKRSKKR